MTAIVIAHNGQALLTQLALDAVAQFTPEPHRVWVVATQSRRRVILWGDFVYITRPRVWPWWSSAKKYAGAALADANQAAREAVGTSADTIFFMHNDAVPVRTGWLSYLLGHLSGLYDKPADHSICTHMAGVKASERNGAPHCSGVLFDTRWLATLPRDALAARMPAWDVCEWPATLTRAWSAEAFCWRVAPPELSALWPEWWRRYDCDVSLDDDGRAFFVHRGGGSWLGGRDIERWTRAARKGLGLT